MSQPSVEAYYDGISTQYDRARFTDRYHHRIAELEERFVVRAIGSGVPRVLEVGPGTGRFTRHLAELAERLTVCDLSQKMLDYVQARLRNPANAAFRHLPIERLNELEDYGQFDAAVAMRIIPHVPDWRAAIRSLLGAIKPGGLVIFDLWNRDSWVGLTRKLLNRRSEVLTHRLDRHTIRISVAELPVDIVDTFRWGYPRLGSVDFDRIGSRMAPSLAYSTVFCCRKRG